MPKDSTTSLPEGPEVNKAGKTMKKVIQELLSIGKVVIILAGWLAWDNWETMTNAALWH